MFEIDDTSSDGGRAQFAATWLIACLSAVIVTFCSPQPAAADEADLGKRCAQTTMAFIAVVDEATSGAVAERKFNALHPEDKEWLATTVFPAYRLAGEPPLEHAVPVVYRNCLKRGAV